MLEDGRFVFGPNVAAFEREAAEYLGVPETVGVANGTDALVLVLDALGIGPRRRGRSAPPSRSSRPPSRSRASARRRCSRTSTRSTLNLDPADVERRLTARTKAIMPVHLFGRPAPLAELAGLRPADHRGRGAGLRLARDRRHRHRLDLQLLPDEEPLRARRRRPDRGARRGARGADPDAPLPRLEGEEDVRVHRLQLAARRGAGGGAAHLPARARRLDGRAARGGRALRRARARRARASCRPTSRATSTTSSSAARPSATASAPR